MGLSTAVDQMCYLILWILCIFVDLEWHLMTKHTLNNWSTQHLANGDLCTVPSVGINDYHTLS